MEQNAHGITFNNAGAEAAFKELFQTHFANLHRYACTILRDEALAEEAVQNVFCRLWEKRDQMRSQPIQPAYLYRSVYNESLNFLKHDKIRTAYRSHASYNSEAAESASVRTEFRELNQRLHTALNELPEQCRTIFQLSRFEELKYREIADRLGISVKTVENQMSKALRLLRSRLSAYLPALCLFIINLKN